MVGDQREEPMVVEQINGEEMKQSEYIDTSNKNQSGSSKPAADEWMSVNIDKVENFECDEVDLIDKLDFFYPFAAQ